MKRFPNGIVLINTAVLFGSCRICTLHEHFRLQVAMEYFKKTLKPRFSRDSLLKSPGKIKSHSEACVVDDAAGDDGKCVPRHRQKIVRRCKEDLHSSDGKST